MPFNAWWSFALFLGYLVTIAVLVPWVLLKKTVHPSAAVAWIFTIIFLPYLGAVLSLLFGMNRVERHRPQKRAASRRIAGSIPPWSKPQRAADTELPPLCRDLTRLAENLTGRRTTADNRVELLFNTNRAFRLIEERIMAAQRWIHVEFYIWRSDRIGTRIRDLLVRKAREGVSVRFLYDGLGSLGLGRGFLSHMILAGMQAAPFLPGRSFRERWSFNLRNHRKIIVIDGQIGFTGGMNVGDEQLGRDPAYGYWRDTLIEIRGPAVHQLEQVFAEDWYYATKEDLSGDEFFPDPDEYGDACGQIVSSGPDNEASVMESLMFAAITGARETVTLASSYFIPPDSLVMALKTAARRGVRVRVLTAKKGNFVATRFAARSYFGELLDADVEIYEYTKGFYHGKTLTVDGCWSLVGSANFDIRSLLLNFEVGMSICHAESARALEAQFELDAADSVRLDPQLWPQRSRWKILGEQSCRLFAPVL